MYKMVLVNFNQIVKSKFKVEIDWIDIDGGMGTQSYFSIIIQHKELQHLGNWHSMLVKVI